MSNERILKFLLCLLVGSLLAWVVTLPAAGQVTDDLIVTINQVDDTSYPLVQVLVSITDQEGHPIESLTDADFSLLQEGNQVVPIDITSASESQQGIAVVLVVDTSGSMNQVDSSGLSALNEAKEAINSFVSDLNTSLDRLAIVSFNSNIVRTHPFSSDISALEQAIESLTANGETRLYDATYDATELIAALPSGRKAIILLTDGQDTESRLTVDDVKDKAGESNVPIFTIGLGPEADPLSLERLATLTGGRYLEAPTAADIVANFNTIADQLRKQYVLTFESDMPANDLRHTLNLNVSSDGKTGEDASSHVARSRPGDAVISVPENGEEVTGQIVISPTLQMPGQVSQVKFLVDSELQETINGPPFTFLWDTSQVEVGDHTLLIQVRDRVGNRAEASTTVSVLPAASVPDADMATATAVDTGEPEIEAAITNPQDGDELNESTRLVVEVAKALHGVRNVEFWVNDEFLDSLQLEPYETVWDVSDFEPGEYTVSALVYDNQGNQYEDNVQVIVSPPPVLLATLANLTSGQEISQTTQLAVTINHAVYGVKRVEFLDDGAVFAIEYTPPYEATWNIDGLEHGEHTLLTRVYDTRGNLWEDAIEVMVVPSQTSWPSSYVYIIGGLLLAVFGFVVIGLIVGRRRRPAYDYSRQQAPVTSTKTYAEAVDEIDDSLATEVSEAGTSELTSPHVEAAVDQPTTEILVATDTDITTVTGDEKDKIVVAPTMHPTWSDQVVTDQPSLPKAYIIGAQGPTGQIQEFPLFERDVTIGRSKDVDIMLLDAKVSRYHAKIIYKNGEFIFQDSQPTNPSYINGEVYSGPHTIKNGDEFVIGRVKLIFRQAD